MTLLRRLSPALLTLLVAGTALAQDIEVTHITPSPQPPLAVVHDDSTAAIRAAFNAAIDRPRVLLLVSPSCPHCLDGATAVQKILYQDTTALRVLVVWEYITVADRKVTLPGTKVLSAVSDPRAIQFWDRDRHLSGAMVRDLPRDTVASVADVDSSGPSLAWDMVALFRPGVRWDAHFPTPDFAGRPIAEVARKFQARLQEIEADAEAKRAR